MNEVAAEWLGRIQPYIHDYGCWFVLAMLFLENVMFLGVAIPGAVVLVVSGFLARQGHISPYPLVLAGFAGTVLGDAVSYLIGAKAGDRLVKSEKWGSGIASVSERVRKEPTLFMFCHFISYLRMFVPLSAGISRMPFHRWLPLDAIGAALWVSTHVAAGYFLSLSGASTIARNISLVIVCLLGLVFGVRFYQMSQARKQAVPEPVNTDE